MSMYLSNDGDDDDVITSVYFPEVSYVVKKRTKKRADGRKISTKS